MRRTKMFFNTKVQMFIKQRKFSSIVYFKEKYVKSRFPDNRIFKDP